ncbi:zinc-binding oxidoreductase CipB [Purpureocillium lavendulum]|uniref:Zinc-binding oxidoreductase CipB n=1 Tax=Purpureocillium lavendulum TaxID=1247861 RepID=A0AB34FIW9_9HYPO|nr:zinc-binding oxidoreductase CipB [Purpureocillium lavendulum]
MPSDDYAAVGGGGALRIKGAKVQKKKKKKDKSDLEKNLGAGGGDDGVDKALVKSSATDDVRKKKKRNDDERPDKDEQDNEDDATAPQKTEAERRYDEVKKKRVGCASSLRQAGAGTQTDHAPTQLLEMTKASGARPELLKTHKERVEELNTYLSKLSEHHDMPKIGPG